MNIKYLHPRDEIIEIINRIYQNGMTTTSGGNLSILDDDGSIWVTPKGLDKGGLTAKDIVRVCPTGKIDGVHKPSSEFPFHKAIYEARPDIRAIVHAHPPALVSFAITGQIPDTRIVPKASEICGEVGFAKYALPGSDKLGKEIANTFKKGFNTVLMENHGIVTIGGNLTHAFQRLETLDFCARLTLKAKTLGNVHLLSNEQLELSRAEFSLDEFEQDKHSSKEKEIRKQMISLIHRSYEQMLMTSLEGTFSAKVEEDSFLITPWGMDRKYLTEEDLVLIKGNKKEKGKKTSRSVKLHIELYKKKPYVNSILIAHPPNILAFGVSRVKFDSKTIPESYLILRDIINLPYGMQFTQHTEEVSKIVDFITDQTPLVLCENDCLIVTGNSLIESFDRLEVAEYSAKSIIASKGLGDIIPIGKENIEELEKAFGI